MSESSCETQSRNRVELIAELLVMALVGIMVVVSTLRLFGILS